LSAHFAIWRASKDGYLRISSSHGAPEDIVCSEHAVALMNHIISADDVVPSASTDFKELYKVCLLFDCAVLFMLECHTVLQVLMSR